MEGGSLKTLSMEQNDDERLKEKLDKVQVLLLSMLLSVSHELPAFVPIF